MVLVRAQNNHQQNQKKILHWIWWKSDLILKGEMEGVVCNEQGWLWDFYTVSF